MIYDNLTNAGRYEDLSENFKKAFQFLQTLNLTEVTEERFEIAGQEVYAFANPVELKNPEQVQYEAHQRYADIQVILKHSEKIFVANTSELSASSGFDAEKDIGFYKDGRRSVPLILYPGEFVVLFPEDAHKPCCIAEDPESFKLVIKVRVA